MNVQMKGTRRSVAYAKPEGALGGKAPMAERIAGTKKINIRDSVRRLGLDCAEKLEAAGVKDLRDLTAKTEKTLLKIDGITKRDVKQIKERLSEWDPRFGKLKDPNSTLRCLRQDIGFMDISIRTLNIFMKTGIRKLEDLLKKSEADLLALPGMGPIRLKEIKDELAQLGLVLRGG